MRPARHYSFLTALLFLLLPVSCKEREHFPETLNELTAISAITDATALVGTEIKDLPPGTIQEYGHVWVAGSKSAGLPTLADFKTVLTPKGALQQFTSQLSDLELNTRYKVRAYVQTSAGLVYGAAHEFTTQADYVERLTKILDDSLTGRDFGYSFIICREGEILGSGYGGLQSRALQNEGEIPLTLDSKMQIASMSKTLTAIAFLRLAREKGIKTTDPISDYLPPYWEQGPNIEQITFRDLLTHRSGIVGSTGSCRNGAFTENIFQGLQALIAQGIQSERKGDYCYQNANFGLFRVLIPAVLGYTFTGEDADNLETMRIYEAYVRDNILEKSGVLSPHILENDPLQPTYGYDYPYAPGSYGFNPGSFRSTAGGYGFYLTAREAAKVYATIFNTSDERILSQALKDSILTAGLGSYSTLTPYGRYSYHDGWWYISASEGKNKGFRSIWMTAPDDLTVVLFTNGLRDGDGLFPIRSDAYYDITSYVLWAFSQVHNRSARQTVVNFHDYLEHPEPH